MLGKSSSFQTSLKSYYYHHQRTEAYNYRIIVASIWKAEKIVALG